MKMFSDKMSNKEIVGLIKDNPKYKYLWDKIKKCMIRYGIDKKYTDVVCECFYGWWDEKEEPPYDKWDEIEENLASYAEDICGEYSCAVNQCILEMNACKDFNNQDDYRYYKSMRNYFIKRCNRHFTIFGWCDLYKNNTDRPSEMKYQEYWTKK
jgi:hypothetical protein